MTIVVVALVVFTLGLFLGVSTTTGYLRVEPSARETALREALVTVRQASTLPPVFWEVWARYVAELETAAVAESKAIQRLAAVLAELDLFAPEPNHEDYQPGNEGLGGDQDG